MTDFLELLDSAVGALSLHITSKDDILKYEEAYTSIRESLIEQFEKKKAEGITNTNFEPKRRNRFYVEFPDFNDIRPFIVRSVIIPTLSRKTYGFIKLEKWSDIRITFFDLIGPSTTEILMSSLIDKKNYNITVKTLDPTGVVVQTWTVSVDKITYINWGEYCGDNDDLSLIDVKFKVKNVVVS